MTLAVIAPTSSSATKPPPTTGRISSQTFVRSGPGWARAKLNQAGVDRILQEAQSFLGVSGFQLARLLGASWPDRAFNRWKSGRQAIGTLYMARLMELVLMKAKQRKDSRDICYAQRIDWETGTIYWRRNGHQNNLPDGGGSMAAVQGDNRD